MSRFCHIMLIIMLIMTVSPVWGLGAELVKLDTDDDFVFVDMFSDDNGGVWIARVKSGYVQSEINFTHYSVYGTELIPDETKTTAGYFEYAGRIFKDYNGGWFLVVAWDGVVGGAGSVLHFNCRAELVGTTDFRECRGSSFISDQTGGFHCFLAEYDNLDTIQNRFYSYSPMGRRICVDLDGSWLQIGPVYDRKNFGAFVLRHSSVEFDPLGYSASVTNFVVPDEQESGEFALCHFTVPTKSKMAFDYALRYLSIVRPVCRIFLHTP